MAAVIVGRSVSCGSNSTRLVPDLVQAMGGAYPELTAVAARVADTLKTEEERFAETLENGMKILETALARESSMIDGETVFALYDTYGFPVDLTADIARERGKAIDVSELEDIVVSALAGQLADVVMEASGGASSNKK